MIEKIFSQDAFLNYFSEFLGIVITVILIPIVINIYANRKNRHKSYLAEKILMTKINNHLDKLVPLKYRDSDSGTVWVEKKPYRYGVIVYSHLLPFSIKYGLKVNLQDYYTRKFKSLKKDKELSLTTIHSNLINCRNDLENFFLIYSDVVKKEVFREFYILDYNIQTCDLDFDKYDFDSFYIYSETIAIVIYCLDAMRNVLLKKHKEISKDYLKEMFTDLMKKTPGHNNGS